MGEKHAPSQQEMRSVSCDFLKSGQYLLIDRLGAKLRDELVVVNGDLFTVDERALHIPRSDNLVLRNFAGTWR